MRLSVSPIWELQKNAYASQGIESWAVGKVPFHMTNNARIADQYAEIAIAAFQNRPFSVMELGGGSGKFAFLFLQACARRGISNMSYLLTDAAPKNELFWLSHPLLKDWMEKGVLTTSLFDPLTQKPPDADMVIANYFFGSLPQDLYRVEKGALLEGDLSHNFQPVGKNPYPDFPEVFEILKEVRTPGSFLFPIGALQTMRKFPNSLFLASDRGPVLLRQAARMKLTPTQHGEAIFSFPVNFHALARFEMRRGGHALFKQSENPPFTVALFSQNETPAKNCFQAMRFGPLETKAKDVSEMIERLEESHWDPTLFFSFFDRLGEHPKLLEGMRRVKEQFFPLFSEEVLALQRLALLFQSMGEEAEAADSVQIASRLQGLESEGSPPLAPRRAEKPSFIRDIEEHFSLNTMVYSDADIEAFLAALPSGLDGAKVLQFLAELREAKNITAKQFEAFKAQIPSTN
jgi:hypothetical protein